ncbi:MAG: hypothetical protein ACI4WH_03095, partial [Oscillospiraceae bacterium]
MPKCKNCGNDVPKKFSFCVYCGANMMTGEKPQVKSVEEPKPTTQTHKIVEPQKVSLSPKEDISTYIENIPTSKDNNKKVVAPPQQKFVSASDTPKTPTQPQVQGNPNRVPQGAKVTPPPQ